MSKSNKEMWKIVYCKKRMEEILNCLADDCEEPWEIVYGYPEEYAFKDWEREIFGLREFEEYFFIFHGDFLAYAVNVDGDSVSAALGELMDLIAKKF